MRCSKASDREQDECKRTLKLAGDVVNSTKPLTPLQLEGMRHLILELDGQRSIADRVLGFFNFVNIVWMVSIIGVLVTVGPCLAYLVGPLLVKISQWLFEKVVRPSVKFLHERGIFEVLFYALACAFSAQSCRYPGSQADAAQMVALTGGLAFVPCWLYSTKLHTKGGGDKEKFFVVSYCMTASAIAPLALIHDSSLMGFITVLCVYGALGFVFFAFGFGFVIGFGSKDALQRCIAASVTLVASFSTARILGVQSQYMRPFSQAGMVLGNNAYFLAMLILSSRWRGNSRSYIARQGAMVGSLVAALLVGSVYAMPSMTNTATTYMVLYFMEKELEVQWGPGFGIVVLFANFVGLYYIAHYLHTHPRHIVSLFDAEGLYT